MQMLTRAVDITQDCPRALWRWERTPGHSVVHSHEQGISNQETSWRDCATVTLCQCLENWGGAHMEGSLKSRSPRERETARPVLVPRAVLMMRQQRCISTRPPLPSTRARSRSSPGLWSAQQAPASL